MNIGFDIDNTLTNAEQFIKQFWETVFKINRVDYRIKNEFTSQVLDMFDVEKSVFEQIWQKYNEAYFKKIPVRKNAAMVINSLKQQGHKIFIVTQRYSHNPYERSEAYLNDNHIPFDKLIVCANDKTMICKKYNIKAFVDDRSDIIEDMCNNGIKAFMIKNYFHIEDKFNCPTVNTLKEFYSKVLSLINLDSNDYYR